MKKLLLSFLLPTAINTYGSEVTIEARAFGGYGFLGWDDGVQEERRTVTVTANAEYTALFAPNSGIDDLEKVLSYIYVQDRHIIVKGIENDRVRIFDVTGRQHQPSEALPSGIYMVQIGNWSKKVLVL